MKVWKDERGGVLIYVLMISIVMVAMIPMVLSLTTNTALSDQVSRNEKLATHLATGGIESFIKYLDNYTSGDREDYLDSFTGFVTNKQFKTPEGVDINYTLSRSALEDNLYDITASATVGTGRTKRTKEIVYRINASMGKTMIVDDPSQRIEVPKDSAIYVQGTPTQVPTTYKQELTIKDVVGLKINEYKTDVETEIGIWSGQAVTCTCSTFSSLKNTINSINSFPAIVRVTGILQGENVSETLGSSSKPVVVILDQPMKLRNGFSLTVNGNLFYMNDFESSTDFTQLTLKIKRVDDSYGNLYVLGKVFAKNNVTVTVDSLLYAGSIELKTQATIDAGKMIVDNDMKLENNLSLDVGTDFMAGSISMETQAELNATAGDIFVENNFYVKNNADIVTGGIVAVGGDMTFKTGNSTIKTGGATSSLIIYDGGSTAGGDDGSAGWAPSRQ